MKDLKDLLVLVLHINETQLLSFVFADKLTQLLAVLNFVKAFNELVSESFNPLNVLVLDLEQSVSNLTLPLSNNMDVRGVLYDSFRAIFLNLLKIFELLFVLLVDILEVFAGNETFEALILAKLAREKCRWSPMTLTVDTKGGLGELLLCIEQERVIDNFFLNMAFHMVRGLLILIFINESQDDFQRRWVIRSFDRKPFSLGSF